jgi:hypothetical protein
MHTMICWSRSYDFCLVSWVPAWRPGEEGSVLGWSIESSGEVSEVADRLRASCRWRGESGPGVLIDDSTSSTSSTTMLKKAQTPLFCIPQEHF